VTTINLINTDFNVRKLKNVLLFFYSMLIKTLLYLENSLFCQQLRGIDLMVRLKGELEK